jgi:sigma-B regulation protein RsbU (phosphoserine phosphatase)
MVIGQDGHRIERLCDGGPALGLLPDASYTAGAVKIDNADTLVLYSDGISEAANRNEQEFGEARIEEIVLENSSEKPEKLCERIMDQVTTFASAEALPDDRTLLLVRFSQPNTATRRCTSEELAISAVA